MVFKTLYHPSTVHYHTVYVDSPWEYKTNRAFQAYVWKEGNLFVNRTYDSNTGAVHEHYFADLREFVIWHYRFLGYTVSNEDYPYEAEVYTQTPAV